MIDWDLWRTVEELGFAGSYAAAAKRLKVDATTVKRRVEILEQTLGRPLFRRQGGCFVPTPACKKALDDVRIAAKHLEMAQTRLGSELEMRTRRKVVITALNYVCDRILSPATERLETGPNLRIEFAGGGRNLDLSSERTADIAVRMGPGSGNGISSWHIADIDYATYLARTATASTTAWATLDRANSHLEEIRLPEQHAGEDGIRFTVTTMNALEGVIQAGAAKGILPRFMGDANPLLKRLNDHPKMSRSMWLLWRGDLLEQPHFGPIVSWIVREISRCARATPQAHDLLKKFEK